MAFSTLFDLVKVTSPSTGQGALVLGAAVAGFLTPDTVIPPITSGTVVSYGITDTTGNEVGQGTLTKSGSFWTLTRGVTQSSNIGAPIFCSGNAVVALTLRAEDVQVAPDVQFLTAASGNYVVPNGVYSITGYLQAGGGGGGGVANAIASAACGGTGTFNIFVMAVTPGQVIAYTCGALGAGGVAGNNDGTSGGDSTFGAVTAKGGPGGKGSGVGNAAGQATNLSISNFIASRFIPTASLFLLNSNATGSSGGLTGLNAPNFATSTPWAIEPLQAGPNAAGGDASGYGGAGFGATSTTGGAFKGGNGSPGAIMIVANPT